MRILRRRYNCFKGNHRLRYFLNQKGVFYMGDINVPQDMWKCLDCGIGFITPLKKI